MKHVTKRFLAIILTLAMCLSLLPGIAMAADAYVLVTDVADITSGGQFVIVAETEGAYKAMSTTLTSGKFVAVDVAVSGGVVTGAVVSGPDIISRGFIYVRENEDIIENTRDVVRQILSSSSLAGEDWPMLKNRIKDELHRFIFEKIKRNPMILPIILDI